MSKRRTERLMEGIRRMAARLAEGDDSLSKEELRDQLRDLGLDPDKLRAEFNKMAKRLAERERLADRPVPLALKQAVGATRPEDEVPRDPVSAKAFAERWIEKFRSGFAIPQNLESVRAYRKSGDVSTSDQEDLDKLEQELKERVRKENEGKS